MAILPLRGCVILSRTTWDKRGPLGVHLCQKISKSVNKRLSYGSFPTERLGDSIQNHIGQKRTLWCSFVPKRSQIRQETADLWLFSNWKVARFYWEPHWTKDPLVFICTKMIQNPSRNGWFMAIFPMRSCVIQLKITWDKKDPLVFICATKIQNPSRYSWVMAILPLRGCVIQLRTILDNGQQGPFGAHLYRKGTLWCSFLIKLIQNSSRNGWLMAISPLRVCMIPLQTTWDKREPFDVHLCQKDPKSAKKRLIYGYFPTETLCDSIENHRGQKGILWCSFVPKRSIIRQEKAELWLLHSVNITTVPVTTLQ